MNIYFISDLHLSPKRPDTTAQFLSFLQTSATSDDSLYILGDLFDFWIGDDAAGITGQQEVLSALKQASENGLNIYFLHGNRDFLVGQAFEEQTGCTILSEPTELQIDGAKVLLMHGDSMCTDDIEHQKFRAFVLNPDWQKQFLNLSINERLAMAMDARSQSNIHKSMTSMEIMDVNHDAVVDQIGNRGADILIHGHTHRPGIHEVKNNGRNSTRIVLGDWYSQSSVLHYDGSEFRLSAHGKEFPPVRPAANQSGA